ncbi:MAG: hypothetical protein ACRDQX_05390 [Pseudonocardiaceae bacterium]
MTDSDSALAAMLTGLRCKPEVLARKLNSVAARHGRPERIHAKTPYKWLRGDLPRTPWPALTATLLTDEFGRPLTRFIGDLTPYRRRPAVRQFTEQATGLLTSHQVVFRWGVSLLRRGG